jgi:hypothetical protein
MAKKMDDGLSKILQEAWSKIPIYETKELSQVAENIYNAIDVIISDLIDVFGNEEFDSISQLFDKISNKSPYFIEKIHQKVTTHSHFKIFNKNWSSYRYSREDYPHTDIYTAFEEFLRCVNDWKSWESYKSIKDSVVSIEEICNNVDHKKRKKNFEMMEKIANYCLQEIEPSFSGFTTTKILRYISTKEAIAENDKLTFDVRKKSDIIDIFNFVQKVSILSVVIFLTDDKKNFISNKHEGVMLLMKYISNVQSMINVGRNRWYLYEHNATKVHEQFKEILKSNKEEKLNRFIEKYCKEHEESVLKNDKALMEIEQQIKKAEKMEKSDAKVKLLKELSEKKEKTIIGLKTHQIMKSAKLKKVYNRLYEIKTSTNSKKSVK